MSDLLNVTSSPHVRDKMDTQKIMALVVISLLPASIFGICNFGLHALVLILVTIASCVASEWIYEKIVHKKSTINDLSAVVTGLLLALNLHYHGGRQSLAVYLLLLSSRCYLEDWDRTS